MGGRGGNSEVDWLTERGVGGWVRGGGTAGLFSYVTCAQYFAELWTFVGFAMLSWGPNGLFILGVSLCNLVPRAVQTTAWYRGEFGEAWPAERKHLVPFVF
eukprot:COSAG01_NODE_1274_length_10946_cov_46.531483_5_plen_101_part_00